MSDLPLYHAAQWSQQGAHIVLEVNLTQIAGDHNKPGLYTLVIYATKPTQLPTHPHDPERYSSALPLLEYTIQWPSTEYNK